jgi:hypothetical protein
VDTKREQMHPFMLEGLPRPRSKTVAFRKPFPELKVGSYEIPQHEANSSVIDCQANTGLNSAVESLTPRQPSTMTLQVQNRLAGTGQHLLAGPHKEPDGRMPQRNLRTERARQCMTSGGYE